MSTICSRVAPRVHSQAGRHALAQEQRRHQCQRNASAATELTLIFHQYRLVALFQQTFPRQQLALREHHLIGNTIQRLFARSFLASFLRFELIKDLQQLEVFDQLKSSRRTDFK